MLPKITVATALVAGLALPSAALAAVERWNIATPVGSPYTASGYIDFDRSTQTVTNSTIAVDTGTKSFIYLDRMTGDRLILQEDIPFSAGHSLYLVDITPLKTSADSPVNLSGYKANCQAGADSRCTDAAGASLDYPVVATLAPAPAPVPTLTEWAMILMGLGLAGAATLTVIARRRA